MENNDPIAQKRLTATSLGAGLAAGVVGGAGIVLFLTVVNPNQSIVKTISTAVSPSSSVTKNQVVVEESSAFIDVAKKVAPSVVSITSTSNVQDFFGQVSQQQSGGTGFIITSDGLIVTNKHVVSDANAKYQVFTADGKKYDATIVATDPFNDLAVIRIKASGLKPVELGSANDLQVGQWVVAIGNALGQFQNTVTVGVISAKNRHIQAGSETGGVSEQLDDVLQTDAAINPGNSGGPLVNLDGQVVGIDTAVAGSANGIGFAIPIDSVKSAIDSVEQTGKIIRPELGVRYVPITSDVAQAANLSVDKGALVIGGSGASQPAVVPGGPADKAGIQANDIIQAINGTNIDENHSLVSLLQQYKPGDTITLTILRDGKQQKVQVKLGQLQ